MKKIIFPLLLLICPILLVAQLNYDEPYIFDSGEFGESLLTVDNDTYILNLRSENTVGQEFLSISATCCDFNITSSETYFNGSSAYNLFTDASTSRLYTTGGIGDSPQNTDIFVSARNTDNTLIWSTQLPLPGYDIGLKTIGTSDNGALTVAVVEDATSGLQQLRILKHEPVAGAATWETYIPIADTGYDIIFQGQVNGEFVYETQPTPPITIVKEVPDGYLIVNPNKFYSPPTQNEQFANIIKLDFAGNVLWNNNFKIPWREIEIGSNSSLNLGLRGRVSSVEGTTDGNTYFTFSSSGDINPNAQYRKLDNTGAVIESFSTSWILNDNFSWLIKEIDGEVYWLKLSEIFIDDGPPINTYDFAIFNITNGISNVEAANNPIAFLPSTPGETFIPKDLEKLPNGDFLVIGDYYESIPFPDFGLTNAPSQPFIVRLQNQASNSSPDINLSVSTNNEDPGIYQNVVITYTVTNEGNTTATDVTAKISRTSASVLAGSLPSVASQGNLDFGYAEEAIWQIGDLAPGQTETLQLTYFTLAVNASFYGEISEMNETDSDSTPNNGTFGNAQEDDEAAIDLGPISTVIRGTVFLDENRDGGENCTTGGCTFISGIEIKLYEQGTNTLIATATSQANGEYIFPNIPTGTYTLEYEYQNNYVPTPFVNGPFGFELRNNFLDINGETPYIGVTTSSTNPERVLNLGLVDGTDCTLEELFVETICNDNGTPNNPNDDTFNVNFRADGNGRAAFSLNSSNGPLWNNSITYSEGFENIGPFDISELPVTLTLNNLGNLPNVSCSLSETINSVNCGNTNGNLPDLTITPLGNIPASMQPGQNYFPEANVTNSGSAAANGQFSNFIFLSTDPNYDPSDVLIFSLGLINLEPGESSEFVNLIIPSNTALGDYYILYVADVNNNITESNENNNVLARPVTIGPIGTGNVDLELTASADVPNIYQNGEAVFTLTNTGSQTATNIEVLFAKNSSLNITGTPTSSAGTLPALHWTDAPEWSVGTLAAGQSATITFNIFSLSETPTLYGQVVFQSEADVDSTPDNGNGSTANEDDEAVYPGGGSTGGEGLQVNCNSTTSPPSPISVNPDININAAQVFWDIPTATTDCPGGIVNIEQINGPTNSGGFFTPVGNGYTVVYEITDECGNSEICIIPFNVNGFAGELVCPDDITVTATSPAGAIVTFGDAIPFTGCNADPTGPADGEPMSGDLFPIGTTEVRFAEFFSGSPSFCQNLENCFMNITVLPEDGGGGDGVDLELTASSNAPAIWDLGTAIFTITNNGNETATGVKLEFKKNNTVNITGTPSTTQGTSQVHWTDTPAWNVGTLAPGQSETITYSIFSLSENINFYGQVVAQNENDADSTPNNGNGTSPNEDDEASFPGDGNTGGGNQADLTLSSLSTQGPAAPGDVADYTVLVSNIGTATASGNYVIGAYLSTDNQLSNNDVLVGVINTGNTPVGTEPLTTGTITVPANQTPGNYFLILETDINGNITESNENNNIVTAPITISGNNSSNGVDLSLDINAPATVNQYENFTAEYIVTNNGTTTATNVVIDFFAELNNNIVFQGGNEGTVSQGGFEGSVAEVFSSNIWQVGNIPPGGSATLTANLFSLVASSNILWAEVAAQNETDSDSTPANATYPQANEDDEVAFTVNITNNLQQNNGSTNSVIQINELSAHLYPVPTSDNLTVDVFTQNAVETQLFIRDTHGKVLTTRNLAAQKGMQSVQILTDNWANGVYFLQLFNGEEMKTYRFLKQ
jgi:hypothetical protein